MLILPPSRLRACLRSQRHTQMNRTVRKNRECYSAINWTDKGCDGTPATCHVSCGPKRLAQFFKPPPCERQGVGCYAGSYAWGAMESIRVRVATGTRGFRPGGLLYTSPTSPRPRHPWLCKNQFTSSSRTNVGTISKGDGLSKPTSIVINA